MKIKEVAGNKVILADAAKEQQKIKKQERSAKLKEISNERSKGNKAPSIEDLDKKMDIIIEMLTEILEGR